jgi:hypothetical protein
MPYDSSIGGADEKSLLPSSAKDAPSQPFCGMASGHGIPGNRKQRAACQNPGTPDILDVLVEYALQKFQNSHPVLKSNFLHPPVEAPSKASIPTKAFPSADLLRNRIGAGSGHRLHDAVLIFISTPGRYHEGSVANI